MKIWSLQVFSFALFLFFSQVIMALDVKTRNGDQRSFDYLELENGLKIFLISDREAQKAAASLDVNVGAGDDPIDRGGLAHFLEHMLFLGSEKYPEPDGFTDYISGHGGAYNAYTTLTHTNYFFDIDAKYLENALDRFSSMFSSPRLDEQYIEREINAVHSEFTSKYTSEHFRNRDVMSELVIPGHPLSRFMTGNLSSLDVKKPRPIKQDLVTFYQKRYSANIMTLVVTGPQSLVQLKSWVSKMFAGIPVNPSITLSKRDDLFDEGFLPARLSIEPAKEIRKLSLLFPVPESRPYSRFKPTVYLSHLMGHEAKGSLLSVLKEAGWATGLSAGGKTRWRGGEAFTVDIALTPEGVNHAGDIEALFFETVALIKEQGLNAWRYEELKNLGVMNFKFAEQVDPIHEVMWIASQLHRVEPQSVFFEPYQYDAFNKSLIEKYLQYFNQNNYLATLVAPGLETDRVSEIYKVPYRLEKKAGKVSSLGKASKRLSEGLFLPEKNEFIPTDFEIYGVSTDGKTQADPVQIINKKNVMAWYANDNTFDVPKASVQGRVRLPFVAESVDHYVMAQMFTKIINESLAEATYNAKVGGLSYSLSANYRGFSLEFRGFHDSLPELVEVVSRQVQKFVKDEAFRVELTDQFFEKVRVDYERRANNRRKEKPYAQIFRDMPSVLYDPYWSAETVHEAYQNADKNRFLASVEQILDGGAVEVFAFGNLKKRHAKKLVKKLVKNIPVKNNDQLKIPQGYVVNLRDGGDAIAKEVPTEEKDQALILYVQGRGDSFLDRALSLVTQQAISTAFFTQLRTEKQLGYVVYSTNYSIKNVPGIIGVIQSPDNSVVDIYKHMQAFFKSEQQNLLKNFERDKQSVISNLNEKQKNQMDLASEYWSQILLENFSFNDREDLIKAVESVSPEQVAEFYKEVFLEKERNLIFAAGSSVESFKKNKNVTFMKDHDDFKKKSSKYAYP